MHNQTKKFFYLFISKAIYRINVLKNEKKILKGEKITFWKVKKVQKSPSITFSITFEKVIKSPFHFQLSLSLTEGENERWKVFFFRFPMYGHATLI